MNIKSIDEVEKELILVSAAIGQIHECNGHYTYGLARIVWELGKPVQSLTVAELILLHKKYGDVFNRIYAEIEPTPHQPLPLRGEATATEAA